MRVLDECILENRAQNPDASISAELNTFPVPVARVSGVWFSFLFYNRNVFISLMLWLLMEEFGFMFRL